MNSCTTGLLEPETRAFYEETLNLLQQANVPFLVVGAYAFQAYTGIERHTKDFDIVVRRAEYDQVAAVLAQEGAVTELTFPHWLGKIIRGDDCIDIIFNSGNGVAQVDERWFERAVPGEVLGIPVQLCPVEEMIWSKAFIMERERYDGADIAHLLQAQAEQLDWSHLLERFGPHWRVLLSHLILFGFIYPAVRRKIPTWVMQDLLERLQNELHQPDDSEHVCQGTLLSRAQYLVDVEQRGYRDARLHPEGGMSNKDIAHWTKAIED